MQVGSIVVVIPGKIPKEFIPYVQWMPISDEKTPYMVRGFNKYISGDVGVLLEEGVIGYGYDGVELGMAQEHLREILPPEDITDQVEDLICVPLKD